MSRIISPTGAQSLSLHTPDQDGDLKLEQVFINEFAAGNRIALHPIYKYNDGTIDGGVDLNNVANATLGIDIVVHKDKCDVLYSNDKVEFMIGSTAQGTCFQHFTKLETNSMTESVCEFSRNGEGNGIRQMFTASGITSIVQSAIPSFAFTDCESIPDLGIDGVFSTVDKDVVKDVCAMSESDACKHGNVVSTTDGVTWACRGCNGERFDSALRILDIPPGKVVCETANPNPNQDRQDGEWTIRNSDCESGETEKFVNDTRNDPFRYVPQNGDQPLSDCVEVADNTYDCDYPLSQDYGIRVQLKTDGTIT